MEIARRIEEKGLEKSLRVKQALESGNSEVVTVYDGAVLFITGGSGFIGKQLVEKILRTCNVKKIYLLLRPKKGKTAIQRLNQILEDPVYGILRSEQPDFASKLIPVEGDVVDLNLGIEEESRKKIIEEVNIIFHGAATINFEETIKLAALTNIRGTREILNLAKSCKQLKSLVHISTAYAHATKSRIKTEIKEDFYNSPLPPDALIQFAEDLENEQLEKVIEPLRKDWPNTYTFTKAITEELVRQTATDLPVCIVRPAIVISAYKEPVPGWVDIKNAYGPSGMVLGVSLGVTHTVHADEDIMLDFVPVDIVNNALIVAAWKTHQSYIAGEKQIKIYFVTGHRNPIYYRDVVNVVKEQARPLVSPKAIWHSFAVVTKYKLIYLLLTWLLHYIPGYIIDGVCVMIGEKPQFIKVYKKVYSVSSVFVYFTNNDWVFLDDNALGLYDQLNSADKELFTCDMQQVDMPAMLMTWFYGVSKFIIKDDVTQYEYAVRKQWWLRIANVMFLTLYFYALYKLVAVTCACLFYFFNLSAGVYQTSV
ncbi:fatty acyl-CoA reductase wat-like [Danaus plexippus]|uniref:fatty acyl-CoA reductase wat-like n=1 Tax=Danaus plexippus TaxID=13037 RepID=UPI002AAFD7EE|nr:fatty acyl-CoA reductase wat-like [Danaus plexippus]XP_061381492.1 fatty acyl-CoA reductase wat-like [Danaus plexippus]